MRAHCIKQIDVCTSVSFERECCNAFHSVIDAISQGAAAREFDSERVLRAAGLLCRRTYLPAPKAMSRGRISLCRGVDVGGAAHAHSLPMDTSAALACLADFAVQANPRNKILPVNNFAPGKTMSLATALLEADGIVPDGGPAGGAADTARDVSPSEAGLGGAPSYEGGRRRSRPCWRGGGGCAGSGAA